MGVAKKSTCRSVMQLLLDVGVAPDDICGMAKIHDAMMVLEDHFNEKLHSSDTRDDRITLIDQIVGDGNLERKIRLYNLSTAQGQMLAHPLDTAELWIALDDRKMLDHPSKFYSACVPSAIVDPELYAIMDQRNGILCCAVISMILECYAEGERCTANEDPHAFYQARAASLPISERDFLMIWSAIEGRKIPPNFTMSESILRSIEAYKSSGKFSADDFLPEFQRLLANPEKFQKDAANLNRSGSACTIEDLRLLAIADLAEADPVDVVHAAAYTEASRDDSPAEISILSDQIFAEWQMNGTPDSILMIAPSPIFIRKFQARAKEFSSFHPDSVRIVIRKKAERELDRTIFPELTFLAPDDLRVPQTGYAQVIVSAGERKIAALNPKAVDPYCAVSSLYQYGECCREGGSVIQLLPAACLSNEKECARFCKSFKATGISVSQIFDLPKALTQSTPRSKMIVKGRRLPKKQISRREEVQIIKVGMLNDTAYSYSKVAYTLSQAELEKASSLHQKEKAIADKRSGTVTTRTARYSTSVQFSREISISYIPMKNHGRYAYAAKAILQELVWDHRKRMHGDCVYSTEKGLHSQQSMDEVIEKIRQLPYDEAFEMVLRQQLSELFTTTTKPISLMTLWYWLRYDLQGSTSYRDDWLFDALNGDSTSAQALRDICPDDIGSAELTERLTAVWGEISENFSKWKNLNFLLRKAQEARLISRNPLGEMEAFHITEQADRFKEVSAAVRTPGFTRDESLRLREFLESPEADMGSDAPSRCITNARWLGAALFWQTSMDFREIAALTWGDLEMIEDAPMGMLCCQIWIRRYLRDDGATVSTTTLRNGRGYRPNALGEWLAALILGRKQWLIEKFHFTEAELRGKPLITQHEPGYRRKSRGPVSHKMEQVTLYTMRKICTNLLHIAARSPQAVEVHQGDDIRKMDLKIAGLRAFKANLKHEMLVAGHFEPGEYYRYWGLTAASVYDDHYADFECAETICAEVYKLGLQSVFSGQAARQASQTHTMIGRSKGEIIENNGTSCAAIGSMAADLLITCSGSAAGDAVLEISSDFGMEGYIKILRPEKREEK